MKLLRNDDGYQNLVPMVLAVVIVFALLFIGTFVTGAISSSLTNTFPAAHYRTPIENGSLATISTIGTNYDSTLSIVQVVIIITILAGAIAAIFLFTRMQ